jgi:CRISPR/Cas system CMR subunit Cmr4 (Cas7 group RAMP superfamily)
METTVQTRHLANLAGAIAEAVEGEPETVESFRSMYGPATVVRDGTGADVILHDRDVTVHVRRDSETD